jgi:carbohydrate kinase (thermoresistant glucokinase family)
MIIQVIGVSGCGKTTIAKKLSEELGLPFFDADDFHPQANIDKMRSGKPLNDHDRQSWLQTLSKNLVEWEKQGGAILACSALKENYRKILAKGLNNCHWVFLSGSYDVIFERMRKRKDHYMSKEMLRSQFEALEVPEYGIHVDIDKTPEEIVEMIKSSL